MLEHAGNDRFFVEKRRNPRYSTLAHARIAGYIEDSGALLKDLSITGGSIESSNRPDLTSGQAVELEVIPESVSKIAMFKLPVEIKWIRSLDYSNYIGFFITASPKGKPFQYYVDYLAWKQTNPQISP